MNQSLTFSGRLFDRDTILHLRIPFSIYLFPVFWFGISQSLNIHAIDVVIIGIVLHLFIYPASNLYNSYMDKDTGSIGGLEHPPPVKRSMYYTSIIVDVTGLLLCLLIDWKVMALVAMYVGFSKAYSWTGIRLKKMPVLGWLSVLFFQGGFTFMLSSMVAQRQIDVSWFTVPNMECMLIASMMLGGSYPLTQVYQHEEDGERGDYTISYKLGIKGTFIFSSVFFIATAIVCYHYFSTWQSINDFFIFLTCLTPLVIYFSWWFWMVQKDKSNACYKYAMLMNKISAGCMILCFSIMILKQS